MTGKGKASGLPNDIEKLVKVLGEQRRVLAAAGSDDALLDHYAALIRFIRFATAEELARIFPERTPQTKSTADPIQPELAEAEIANMPRNEVERIINDEATPRRLLEEIAVHRFQVPRGSMRRFSNRDMLIDKLATLLRNEQAHTAIEAVARGQSDLPGVRSR